MTNHGWHLIGRLAYSRPVYVAIYSLVCLYYYIRVKIITLSFLVKIERRLLILCCKVFSSNPEFHPIQRAQIIIHHCSRLSKHVRERGTSRNVSTSQLSMFRSPAIVWSVFLSDLQHAFVIRVQECANLKWKIRKFKENTCVQL